ncbi:S4 domain-containing protein YaaA [Shimazuella alba]|jgi:S4 domain protein YaaA|uniref:S4 domain-containing protein YaaA n=1 Tax=Shimazuella alba TaxID=2690964 RepID=A0A6I4VX95_9BACL|nr:S4 domain-containing protein YaaA [Shimazuella alba]MXQ53084.1 S4 domain-containing protein YaaA [Shimazuella alba]
MKKIAIQGEYMTLGQLLKSVDLIASGGEAKIFLQTYQVLINGEPDDRRGRKLYPQDKIGIEGYGEIYLV